MSSRKKDVMLQIVIETKIKSLEDRIDESTRIRKTCNSPVIYGYEMGISDTAKMIIEDLKRWLSICQE